MIAGLGLAGAGNLLYRAELALPPLESWECKAGFCGTVALVNAALNLPPGDAKSYYLSNCSGSQKSEFRSQNEDASDEI